MNQITYLIFVILFVYGISEFARAKKRKSEIGTKTNNSNEIILNYINSNKIDLFVPSSEGSTNFVENSSYFEISKPNPIKISAKIFKINENLISSQSKGVELTSLSKLSSLAPSIPARFSRKGTMENKESTSSDITTPKREERTTKKFESSELNVTVSSSPFNMSEVKLTIKGKKVTTKKFAFSVPGVAETTTKLFVPSDEKVVETTLTLPSESFTTTLVSPTNTLIGKSTTKGKEINTKAFAFSEIDTAKITQTLPSKSTETTTSPSNISIKDTISSLIITTAKQASSARLNTQTVSAKTFHRHGFKKFRQDSFPEGKKISCTFVSCELLSKKYLSRQPAICPVGCHGSSCARSCFSCLGKLCQINGDCLFDKSPFCDNYGCRQNFGLVQRFQLKEIKGYVAVIYDGSIGSAYSPAKLTYWTFKSSRLKNEGVYKITEVGTRLPIKYKCKFIVCIFVFQRNSNYLEDIECQRIYINSRCLGYLKNVDFGDKVVTWEKKERLDLFHYGVYLSFESGACGRPARSVLINHTNLTSYQYPNLKGRWKICVSGEKEVHEKICNTKKICRTHDFARENVEVTDLTVENEGLKLKISWSFPESWESNCGSFKFEMKVLIKGFPLINRNYKPNLCQSRLCSIVTNNLKEGLYGIEVTPIFAYTFRGTKSQKSTYISCPKSVTEIEAKEENNELYIKWYDNNDNLKGLFYNVSVQNRELCKIPNFPIYWIVDGKNKEIYIEKNSSTFGVFIKVSPHVEGCPPLNNLLRFIPPLDTKVSFSLKNLTASLVDDSVKLSWEIPSQWENICIIKDFKILLQKSSVYMDNRVLNQSQICNDLSCTFTWDSELDPITQYTFVVYAYFEYAVFINESSVSIETPEACEYILKWLKMIAQNEFGNVNLSLLAYLH